jgi:hypothetical protein
MYSSSCFANCSSNPPGIGFWGDDTEYNCKECHPICLTCEGGNDNNCLSCKEPLFLEGKECK